MNTPYVEQNCVFPHQGQNFESGGSVVTNEFIIGYMSSDMKALTTWHGEKFGYAHVISSWKINSWFSSKMYQVEVKVNGIWYTGRTMGGGMIYKGKAKKRQ